PFAGHGLDCELPVDGRTYPAEGVRSEHWPRAYLCAPLSRSDEPYVRRIQIGRDGGQRSDHECLIDSRPAVVRAGGEDALHVRVEGELSSDVRVEAVLGAGGVTRSAGADAVEDRDALAVVRALLALVVARRAG